MTETFAVKPGEKYYLPNPPKGNIIKAFVTLRVGASPGDDLTRHVRKSPGPVAVPAEIESVDRTPKIRSASNTMVRGG